MAGYVFITVIAIMLFYDLCKNIYLFKKGQYIPYPYRRIKDRKIIFQTVIFDIMIIAISTGIWLYAFTRLNRLG